MRLTAHCSAALGLACIPPWTVNAGFVAGERRTLLVDTGYAAATARTLLGYAAALRPGNALVAVVTEPHLDHVLGVATLRDAGVDVLGHVGVARTAEDLAAEEADYALAVVDPVRRARGEARLPFAGTRVEAPNVKLAADAEVDLGGVTARLLLAPGHTASNLLVHVPEDRLVFAGDTVVEGYLPNLEAGGPALWREWHRSLDRLAALDAAGVVPGHGAVLEGAAVAAAVDAVRRVLDEALATGRPPTRPAP